MPEVIIPEDENFERALRRFKKKGERAAYYGPPAASPLQKAQRTVETAVECGMSQESQFSAVVVGAELTTVVEGCR